MDYNLVYDILIFARQLSPTIEFVDRHPNQPFVLDHIAKPTISSTEIDENWQLNIRELSHRENVTCKFSGLVTEVRDDEWSVDVLRPYWDTVVEAFGPERLMYGSDWPVCLLRTDYARWVSSVAELADQLSSVEQAQFWAGTAQKVYRL